MIELVKGGGSDLHLAAGQPPYGRFNGQLRPIVQDVVLSEETCNRLIFSLLNNSQRKHLEQNWDLDCSYGLKDVARFRVNVYRQRGTYAACLRALGNDIPSLDSLGMPAIVEEISRKPKGLLLVTGPTGSGKSTTLAALLNHINHTRAEHILTIEDPIEFTYKNDKSLIHQREVSEDTRSFANALRAALREDPDVILVGEMRDLETIEAALVIAETGHLVFATLHTNSCVQTINRVLDVFPPYQQPQVRAQMSFVLEGVLSQTLIPKASGSGRVLALEVMVPNPAIRNLIREEKIHQVYGQMQIGQAKFGMQTMNQALAQLVNRRIISFDDGLLRSSDQEEFRQLLASPQMQPGGQSRRPQ